MSRPEMVRGRLVGFLVRPRNDSRLRRGGQVLAEIEAGSLPRPGSSKPRGKLDLAEAELKRQEAGA